MIVAGAIAPHGTPAFAEGPTRRGLQELGRRFSAATPDAIVVVTPHNIHVEGHFAIVVSGRVAGSLAEWGQPEKLERPVDCKLATDLVAAARGCGLPVVSVSYGGNDPVEAVAPLDWGTLIPLAFLPELPVVVVSPARDRPLEEHVRLGEAIATASAAGRVALVASADHAHTHDRAGPYGLDPAAAVYDERVVQIVRDNRLGDSADLVELVDAAKADSLWQLLVLHGALGNAYDSELLSYEAPTYFGMLCAAYHPAGRDRLI